MKSPEKSATSLTAVVMTEVVGNQVKFVAQCVEYDICVQASSMRQLKERLFKTLHAHVFIARKCGLEPFTCMKSGAAGPADGEWGMTEKVGDGCHELTLQLA